VQEWDLVFNGDKGNQTIAGTAGGNASFAAAPVEVGSGSEGIEAL